MPGMRRIKFRPSPGARWHRAVKEFSIRKIIHQLADKYGKTPAQIVIRWHLDSGLVVIPKSVTPSRIAENFNVWDFRLDKDELSEITKLDKNKRLGPDPDQFGG
ncbi:methylglyoxal reductase [Klebsiella oxytoca]|nr:methylglyoxal reductase [Klebsiella oxytoca]